MPKDETKSAAPSAYLRPPEEAARLGVSLRLLASWQAEGLVPFFKIGRCVLFDPSATDAALQKFRRGPPTSPKRRAVRVTTEKA
jgi:hypothetical protein